MATTARATIDDVLRLASKGKRYELVDGELVEMTPTGYRHGRIERRIARVLGDHVEGNDLGEVVVGEVLFQLDPAGRLSRAADVAFIGRDRVPTEEADEGPFIGAPDVAIEIVSEGDMASYVELKVDDWLTHGTKAVLAIFPTVRRIALWRGNHAVTLRGDDLVDLDPIIPGFHCKVSDLFPPIQRGRR